MLPIDPPKVAQDIIGFIKDTFAREGFTRGVIALSGGVDSSACCTLACRALGKDNIFPMLLPYGNLNPQGGEDAFALVDFLGIPRENTVTIDIKPLVDAILVYGPSLDHIRSGNVMARIRMILVFDQAKRREALVLGTENKSEFLLGYFTRFGDAASDVEPLIDLYKTQVYQLARYLEMPQPIITKQPTAGLWEGQTDEAEFGFTYAQADEILYLMHDEKKSDEEIAGKGFEMEVIKKVKGWLSRHDYKHRVPYVPK